MTEAVPLTDDVRVEIQAPWGDEWYRQGRWGGHLRSARYPAWHPVVYGASRDEIIAKARTLADGLT